LRGYLITRDEARRIAAKIATQAAWIRVRGLDYRDRFGAPL